MEDSRFIEIRNLILEVRQEILVEVRILTDAVNSLLSQLPNNDEEMTRLEVIEYLGISPRTYIRRVKDGTLKPRELPGGHRYYLRDLAEARKESIRKGKI